MLAEEQFRYDQRVAIVTGAGRGLGREHALILARRGALVVVNDLGAEIDGTGSSKQPADSVVQEIHDAGGQAIASYADVSEPEGAQAIIDSAIGEYGRLDIVVNNAGVLRYNPIGDVTTDDIAKVIGVHLNGTILVTRAAWPHLRRAQYGRVVCVTSSSVFGQAENSLYAAAKAGAVGFLRTAALEGAADGILVNGMMPAAWTRLAEFSTREAAMTPEQGAFARRAMRVQNNAGVVAYLAHESCALTGETLSYSGGRLASMVLAETEGVPVDVDVDLTPEQVASDLDQIMNKDVQHYFRDFGEVIQHTQQQLIERDALAG